MAVGYPSTSAACATGFNARLTNDTSSISLSLIVFNR
jgi:hypothetical protein